MSKFQQTLILILLTNGLISFFGCKHQETMDLKIMSYNIRHGLGLDTILDLSRSATIIKSNAPDLCALQEIDNFCLRSDSISQIGYLAQNTLLKGTFGKFMDYQKGEYGMATLTAKPLISTKNVQLPDGKYEPRTSIVHEVQIAKECTIAFANVHFDWVNEEEGSSNRMNQAKALTKYLDSLNRAAIITGDFNCIPNSPTMQYFAEQGFVFVEKGMDNLSFQGKEKDEIDHLIFRNHGDVKFTRKNAYLIDEPIASDHRPLIVELEVSY